MPPLRGLWGEETSKNLMLGGVMGEYPKIPKKALTYMGLGRL